MKSFFKYLLASFLGVVAAMVIVFFIFVGIIGVMIASTDKPTEVKPQTLLHLELDDPIVDRSSKDPFDSFDFMTMGLRQKLGLNDILNNIEKAKNDDNIEGIFLEISMPASGLSTLGEIREALEDFRESGKFIVASSDVYTQPAYYLASVADEVFLTPTGAISFQGLRSEIMFFKGTLDKLGVDPQVIRHGDYKSAAEPFVQEEMSPENRGQIMTYLSSIWDHILESISDSRGIDVSTLDAYASDLTIRNDRKALEHGFVDGLKYRHEIIEKLKELTGIEEDEDLRTVKHSRYIDVPKKSEGRGVPDDKVAVVYAQGPIVMGEGGEEMIGPDRISRTLREARQDPDVKAIVLRVNSPGGSALASEVIWREVKEASKEKVVIASMGDVAASGGYYIVAGADRIVANPHTITGSIGVIGMLPNAEGFFKERLGITVDVAKTNEFADMGSIFRPLAPTEREFIKEQIGGIYEEFVSRVAEGRDMEIERVDEIGRGRVWSGEDARELGLIDDFGGLSKAIDIAVEEAEIEEYRVVSLPVQKDPLERLLEQFGGNVRQRIVRDELGDSYRYFEMLKESARSQGIQARLPFELRVY